MRRTYARKAIPTALALGACALIGCDREATQSRPGIPVVAFLDFVQDDTLAIARKAFLDALDRRGYSVAKGTIEFAYRCANGDQTTLMQACQELIARRPKVIATCPTLSTIVAAQRTKDIPIVMMVSPRPDLVGLPMPGPAAQSNLIGAYETLDYIAQGPAIIREVLPHVRKVGLIYNPAEPQSVLALDVLKKALTQQQLQLEATAVSSSADAPMAAQALIARGAEVFFALPDNIVFASFEGIVQIANDKHVPVFTSESGLVARGALAAYGADLYAWGRQAGDQAASVLAKGDRSGVQLEEVAVRKRVFNPAASTRLGIQMPAAFEPVAATKTASR
jgi:putative ABC transport system substrate-binding protein